jgi:RNA polymerase sigma-70 factor, ECF subfamily
MDPNDQKLWKGLRRSDRAAYEAVVDSHYQAIYRQQYLLCGDAELARDLTQETFVEAWKSLAGFEGRSALSTWLYTIAARVWRRRGKVAAEVAARLSGTPLDEMADFLPDAAPDLADALSGKELRVTVRNAVDRLPAVYREAVVLFYAQGMTHTEVADVLGVPVGTVKSRLHEGVRRLQRLLTPLREEVNCP